ncbi:XRE family transcriptional regulator [Acidithiobacillus sp.]|uniref:helix-turn-helix domain-containing protein n=1 Tax=Acidithiobacillus sp. TaxID=1872118 RepID=UPI0025BB3172|nr:XRE family transcriptional regulator [Acidithiobacillus sp.]
MEQVCKKIRQLREDKGWSVRGLAARAEISPSALSQIEAGQNSPSIATLEKICAALQIPIVAIFDDGETAGLPLIMRSGDRRKFYSAGSHASLEPLARGLPQKKMQPLLMVLEPGGECGEHPYTSAEGEEFTIVIHGTAAFEQSGVTTELGEGDAIYYNPRLPHNWHNRSHSATTLLVVVAQ